MATNVVTLKSIETVDKILAALKSGHHGFPILNKKGNVTGLIPRNFIIVILRNFQFYDMVHSQSTLEIDGPQINDSNDLSMSLNSRSQTKKMEEASRFKDKNEKLKRKQLKNVPY